MNLKVQFVTSWFKLQQLFKTLLRIRWRTLSEYTQFCYRWAEEECNENVRLFRERLRDTDPNGLEPGHVAKHHDEWYGKLEEDVESVIDAVDEFCADFGQTLGLDRVKAWKETSKLC